MSEHPTIVGMQGMSTAPQLLWRNAGNPTHKYTEEPYEGLCATCAVPCEVGASTGQVNNPTFSNHAEFFRYGTHVCRACAWLYGIGKGRPGNIMAAGEALYRPVISEKSATEERPTWLDVLGGLQERPDGAPVAGVLTTDTKPRVWPRMRIASVGDFGLYVHAPEYAVSEYRSFALAGLLDVSGVISVALGMGFSKQRIHSGLLADFARAKKSMKEVVELEKRLQLQRERPEFVPALIVTYKGLNEENNGVSGRTHGAGDAGGEAREDGDRLFQL